MNKMKLTIAIPTKDRYFKIRNLLKSLEKQTFNDFLILIIDASESFVNLELDGKETYLKASIESYEDLTKPKDQRYEFVYPNFSLTREINLDNSYNGNFIFDAQGYQKKYANH